METKRREERMARVGAGWRRNQREKGFGREKALEC